MKLFISLQNDPEPVSLTHSFHLETQTEETAALIFSKPPFHKGVLIDCCTTAFFLLLSSGSAQQNLSAATFCMMNMPVIPAPRFKRYVSNGHALCCEHIQVALPYKILCKRFIFPTNGNTLTSSGFMFQLLF